MRDCSNTVIAVTLVYTSTGKGFRFFPNWDIPAAPEDKRFMVEWMPKITELVGTRNRNDILLGLTTWISGRRVRFIRSRFSSSVDWTLSLMGSNI